METRYGSRSARRLTAPGINPERAPKGDAVTGEEGRPSESEAWHHVGCHECEEEEHYSTFLTGYVKKCESEASERPAIR